MRNKRDPVFTRKLISLVMPIAFQQFMLALVSASDALMLGVISQDSLYLWQDRLLLFTACF